MSQPKCVWPKMCTSGFLRRQHSEVRWRNLHIASCTKRHFVQKATAGHMVHKMTDPASISSNMSRFSRIPPVLEGCRKFWDTPIWRNASRNRTFNKSFQHSSQKRPQTTNHHKQQLTTTNNHHHHHHHQQQQQQQQQPITTTNNQQPTRLKPGKKHNVQHQQPWCNSSMRFRKNSDPEAWTEWRVGNDIWGPWGLLDLENDSGGWHPGPQVIVVIWKEKQLKFKALFERNFAVSFRTRHPKNQEQASLHLKIDGKGR